MNTPQLSSVIRWSVIANIGNLPVMRMVMFIPFIGTLIIFNQTIVDLLSLSLDVINARGNAITVERNREISIANLYYLYFGLLLLGLGSIIFTFRCPKEIKKSHYVDDFIYISDRNNSSVTIKSNLKKLISLEKNTHNKHEIPPESRQMFHDLILEIYREFEKSNEGFVDESLYYANGYINIEKISNMIDYDVKANWGFSKPFQDISIKYSGDILRGIYEYLDYSRHISRLLISVCYFFGFILLTIPTAKVIAIILF